MAAVGDVAAARGFCAMMRGDRLSR
jgi:hypothetical protein